MAYDDKYEETKIKGMTDKIINRIAQDTTKSEPFSSLVSGAVAADIPLRYDLDIQGIQPSGGNPNGYVSTAALRDTYGSYATRDGVVVDGNGSGSGGVGGSSVPQPTPKEYTAAILPSAKNQSAYINALYDAQLKNRKQALQTAYDNSIATIDEQARNIPQTYRDALNQANAQAAVANAAYNEYAAANGVGTGTGSQVRLAQNNAAMNRANSIQREQANALAEVDAQRQQVKRNYQNAIAEAIAENDAERANALYQEAVRVDNSIVNTALNQATENYKAWVALYG